MAQGNAQVIREAFDAFARGDLAATQAYFHTDAELRTLRGSLDGEVHRGENLIDEFVAGVGEAFDDYSLELEGIEGEGDAFVATVRNRARARGTGIPLDQKQHIAFLMKDGRVWRAQVCPTMDEAREVAGLTD